MYEQTFDSPLKIKVTPPRIYMFVKGSHAFAMFYAHVLCEWVWPRAQINVTTFTRFANIGSICLHCMALLCM